MDAWELIGKESRDSDSIWETGSLKKCNDH